MSFEKKPGRILLCAVLAAVLLILGSCGSRETDEEIFDSMKEISDTAREEELKSQRQVYAMDTVMILTAYGPYGEEALSAAEQEIRALEEDLDPASPTGSVYALNEGAGAMVTVSEDCLHVLQTSLEIRGLTEGALDPALYILSRTWGFIGGNYRVPTAEEIAAQLPGDASDHIRVDEAASAAVIPIGVEVGFGAVAKGYTAQKVIDLMRDMGVKSAILSLGGNVQTLGDTKPDGSQWQVAVQDPNDTGSYVGILAVGETAVVTSGGYQRFFEEGGVTYIHILDPESGYPVDNDLLSVTVVTEDGARADALSTALFVMGKDRALAFCEAHDEIELVLITKENSVIVTPGLVSCFSEKAEGYTYEYLS